MSFFKKPAVVPCGKGGWIKKQNGWTVRNLHRRSGPRMKETKPHREPTLHEQRLGNALQMIAREKAKAKAKAEAKAERELSPASRETSREEDKPRRLRPWVQNRRTKQFGTRTGRVKTFTTESGQITQTLWQVQKLLQINNDENAWWDVKDIIIMPPNTVLSGQIEFSRGDV